MSPSAEQKRVKILGSCSLCVSAECKAQEEGDRTGGEKRASFAGLRGELSKVGNKDSEVSPPIWGL